MSDHSLPPNAGPPPNSGDHGPDDALEPMPAGYASVQAELREVPVEPEVRERAIAAALAAFDEIQAERLAPTAAATAAVSLAERRERRQARSRWLSGIAAAAVVAFLGVVVIQSGRGSDDDESSATAGPAAAPLDSSVLSDSAGATTPMLEAAAETTAAAATAAGGADTDAAQAPEESAAAAAEQSQPLPAVPDAIPSFDNEQQVIDYVTGSVLDRDGSKISTGETTAESTADSFAATTAAPETTEVAETTAGTEAPFVASTCTFPTGEPVFPAVYRSEPVLVHVIVVDPVTIEIVDPATCAVRQTIPAP